MREASNSQVPVGLVGFLFLLFLIACTPLPATAQVEASPTLASVRFIVSTPGDTISLRCEAGCAWTELSFPIEAGAPAVAVNEFGMTRLDRPRVTESADLTRFLFTIRLTTDGVQMQGLEGFAWTGLTYSCGPQTCEQAINQNGMTRW